jgi:hypothetical protein
MTITRMLLAAGLSLAAIAPFATTSASAQSFVIQHDNGGYVDRGFDDGDNTVVIRRHHDNGWHRGWDRHAGWRDRESFGMGGCRMVTIRRQNDMGDTIIKRMRRCD